MTRKILSLFAIVVCAASALAQPPLPADGALYVGTSQRGRTLLMSLHLFPPSDFEYAPEGAELQLLEAPAGPGEEPSIELTLTGPYLEHQRELEVTTETWTFIADLLPGGALDSRGEAQLYLGDGAPIEFQAMGTVLLGKLHFADDTFAVQRWAPFFYDDPWKDVSFDLSVDEILSEGLQQRRELPQMPAGIFSESRTVRLAALGRDLVSFYTVFDRFTGGAHPNSWREATTLENESGWWQRIDSICEVPVRLGWACDETTLRRKVIDDLLRQQATWVEQGEVTEETEWLLDSFVITPWSVRVLFDPYAVGPYVQGPFEVDIAFEDLAR